ncbi:MAG: ScyD/ScyE family protein [Acidimicrobiales bacterium]|nr:ScyD/ScyE family protein [Acidimicrobiales bacterium]
MKVARARWYVTAAAAVGLSTAATAAGAEDPDPTSVTAPGVEIVARGLDGPREFQLAPWGTFYVAEADTGEITQVEPWNGETATILDGLPGPQGVALTHRGDVFVLTGGAPPPEEGAPPPPPSAYPEASLLRMARWTGQVTAVADLAAYDLEANPDGQRLFDDAGVPLDAISNPFYVVTRPGGGAIVADGGANDVLSIDADGTVRTLFVPPLVTAGACADRPNNDPEHAGCDAVPTGLAYGPDGALYVSTLSGEAPGLGIVYKINPYDGSVLDTIGGLDSPTGVAVGDDGSVYVSEGIHGAPQGPPPADFDPAAIGRIVRIAPDGARSYAAVTMPVGLLWDDGELFSTAWSLTGPDLPGAGQIVRVGPEAFLPAG